MARWLLGLSVVILGARGYTAGNWALVLNPRVAVEVVLLVIVCSIFVGYTTYALIWKALSQMYGPKKSD
jgi:N-acetyl-gamma-glutamylphosphate reductase